MMSRTQNSEKGENPSRTSKLPAGGVVLLVLAGLLAAAVFVIFRLSFVMLETRESLQTLKEEIEALGENISELMSTQQPSCPPPPEAKSQRDLVRRPEWEKYQGSLYYFSIQMSSWNKSRRSCTDLGSDLVKIDSREEQVFLESRLRGLMENQYDKFWIGLTDSEEEGKWLWVDGSPLNKSLSFWMSWEPDDWKVTYSAGEDCAAIGIKEAADDLIRWFDQFCSLARRSICEKPADLPKPAERLRDTQR
ncbi:PREDICTED: hepatic lectin-like [Poecilia mexicana]|uniref:C-type lectin domain-containing protein n=1 Tax=Poecilia mexicana TaxID=48701 RepID=A0A3B3WCL7_9TELE|nr:PREDICTED: hepatic lectin-like [Poecilia mexicana]